MLYEALSEILEASECISSIVALIASLIYIRLQEGVPTEVKDIFFLFNRATEHLYGVM